MRSEDQLHALLADIEWQGLFDAYGSAEALPGMIRALLTPDFEEAVDRLENHVCHQGDRCDASAAIINCLCLIVDLVSTEAGVRVLDLIAALALGEHDEFELPFSKQKYASVAALSASEIRKKYASWLEAEEPINEEIMEVAPFVWELEAYTSLERNANELLRWSNSTHVPLAAYAFALTPWFPETKVLAQNQATILVERDSTESKVSALISLGLHGLAADNVDAMLSDPNVAVRVAAALNMAWSQPNDVTDEALEVFLAAESCYGELNRLDLPFHRGMTAFVSRTIRQL